MRVEAHIQGSSIWTYISRETEPWPLRIRNETELNLKYQQVVSILNCLEVPLLTIQEGDGAKGRYKSYDLPAKDHSEYVWDYPTAPNKRIQIICDGVPFPRNIDMMAIGVQPPLRLPVCPRPRAVDNSTDTSGWSADRQQGYRDYHGDFGGRQFADTGHQSL